MVKKMKEIEQIIIKWIEDNADDLKNIISFMVIFDFIILAISIITGEFVNLFLNSIRIVLAEILLVYPMTVIFSNIKKW